SVNPNIDPRLSDWIDRMLVKDVTERTRTAEAAQEELDEILSDLISLRWRRESGLQKQVGPPLFPGPYTPPPDDAVESADATTPALPTTDTEEQASQPVEAPVPKPGRNRRALLAVGAAAAVVVAGGAALVLSGESNNKAPPDDGAAVQATPGPTL